MQQSFKVFETRAWNMKLQAIKSQEDFHSYQERHRI